MIKDAVNRLLPVLTSLSAEGFKQEEDKNRIFLSGSTTEASVRSLLDFLGVVHDVIAEDSVAIDIDGSQVGTDDLEEILSIREFNRRCSVIIDKNSIIKSIVSDTENRTLLFFDIASFIAWGNTIDAVRNPDAFSEGKSLKILVNELPVSFGGPKVAVIPLDQSSLPTPWPFTATLPDDETIRTQVHVATTATTYFLPDRFVLTWGDLSSTYAESFCRNCACSLAACLVQDFFGTDRVVIRGAKRVELPFNGAERFNPDFLLLIKKVVEWVYEERVETRAKLLSDRLSLEIDSNSTFLAGLLAHLSDAFEQSREQYGFVILDRKDAYVKELRDLLKDVRSHGDLCVQKIRSILSNLLRDVIATFVLIAISLLTRLGNNPQILASREAGLLFKALGIYLFCSPIFQFCVDVTDIRMTNSENKQWLAATRNYMPLADVKKYFDTPVAKRIHSFYTYSLLFSLVYFSMGYLAWNAQQVLQWQGIIPAKKQAAPAGAQPQHSSVRLVPDKDKK